MATTSLFGSAKTVAKATTSDKKEVQVAGLGAKLHRLNELKAEAANIEAELGGITDEVKNISKDEFVRMYKESGKNPDTFYIKDGDECIMCIPMDKYISVKDKERAEQLEKDFGAGIVTTDEKFYFNPEVLERNRDVIEKLLIGTDQISDKDKENLLLKDVKYSISKGAIDRLPKYGDILTVMDAIQPIFQLKNCGGKAMENGGEVGEDTVKFDEINLTLRHNGTQTWKFNSMSSDTSKVKADTLTDRLDNWQGWLSKAKERKSYGKKYAKGGVVDSAQEFLFPDEAFTDVPFFLPSTITRDGAKYVIAPGSIYIQAAFLEAEEEEIAEDVKPLEEIEKAESKIEEEIKPEATEETPEKESSNKGEITPEKRWNDYMGSIDREKFLIKHGLANNDNEEETGKLLKIKDSNFDDLPDNVKEAVKEIHKNKE